MDNNELSKLRQVISEKKEEIKFNSPNLDKISEHFRQMQEEKDNLLWVATKGFSEIEKTLVNASLLFVKEESIVKKEETGDPYYWRFGEKIPTKEVRYTTSTIDIKTKEGAEYSFFYNGSVEALRKDDIINIKVYSFDEKAAIDPHKDSKGNFSKYAYFCIPREIRNGDEAFYIESKTAGRIYETVPKKMPYIRK